MQVVRRPHLYGLSGNESQEQIEDIVRKELKRRVCDCGALMETAMRHDMRKIEFTSASIGTLLWAFADLVNKI